MIDLAPPQVEFPRPAIIRPATAELLRYGSDPLAAMLPGISPVVAGRAKPELAFLGGISTPETTASFNVGSFAVAKPGLMIAVCTLRTSASRVLQDVTFGGNSGVLVGRFSGSEHGGIFSAEVGAGTHAVVVQTSQSGSSNGRSAVFVWFLTGYRSPVATAYQNSSTSQATSKSVTLDIPAGGVAVYGSHQANTAVTSWSGATLESSPIVSGDRRNTTAYTTVDAASPGRVATASWTESNTAYALGASWR